MSLICSLMWMKRPTSRTSSTASSSTSSSPSRKSMKKWTRQRECPISSQLRSQLADVQRGELNSFNEAEFHAAEAHNAHPSLLCFTCLTCVPVNPFLLWHICWCASKLNQQILNRHTQLLKIHLIYLSLPARQPKSAVGHVLRFSKIQPCTPGLRASRTHYSHISIPWCSEQLYH